MSKLGEMLKEVKYDEEYYGYEPSVEAIEFMSVVKLIYAEENLENTSPPMHYMFFDSFYSTKDTCIVAFRGSAKSTFIQNLFFYVAVMGKLPSIGKVDFMIYVSDSMDNGVKTMTEAMRYTYEKSKFLQKYLPNCKFLDSRWVLNGLDGSRLIVRTYGALQGIRGAREQNKRPHVAIIDDVLTDDTAESPTKLKKIKKVIFNAIEHALHPKHSKAFLIGTPFHDECVVTSAIESGSFHNLVFPICEKFPCKKEDFRGAWEDRNAYDQVLKKYEKAKGNKGNLRGEDVDSDEENMTLDGFYQELMMDSKSAALGLVDLKLIPRFSNEDIMNNKQAYTFYVTTDFATKDNAMSDLSGILVWAYDDARNLFIVDGEAGHNLMTKNLNILFGFVHKYNPLSVSVEVGGQQGGFISFIRDRMYEESVHFELIEVPVSTNKIVRFLPIHTRINAGRIWVTEDDVGKVGNNHDKTFVEELFDEWSSITKRAITSKFDDMIDTSSQIDSHTLYLPYYRVELARSQVTMTNQLNVFRYKRELEELELVKLESSYII